ncbi:MULTISPECIES: VanZ family protein [Kitasatospora]|uniref:VanZ family protein n=1 Tax=Kitasatospora TaxID=2063 RepID=UPI00117D06E3|nr:VanZ family protein [Kitasatospora sp. GP30]MDH6140741.1 glycopeptide antibiotics resistance protein [Kitasatospora sp. GP30]
MRSAPGTVRIPEREPAPTARPEGGAQLRAHPRTSLPLAVRSAALLLLTLHVALLGWLMLRQVPTAWAYDANLTPFATLHRAFSSGSSAALGQALTAVGQTAPLGVLLPLIGGRLRAAWFPSFLQAIGSSALFATGLEVLETSAGRVLNVDDVLIGVIGAALAHLLVVPATRAALRRGRAAMPSRVVRFGADPETVPDTRVVPTGETPGARIGIQADA